MFSDIISLNLYSQFVHSPKIKFSVKYSKFQSLFLWLSVNCCESQGLGDNCPICWIVTFFQGNKPISIFRVRWGCGRTNLDPKWHFYKDSIPVTWVPWLAHTSLCHNYILHFEYSNIQVKDFTKGKGWKLKTDKSTERVRKIVYLIDPCFGRFKLSAGWWQ